MAEVIIVAGGSRPGSVRPYGLRENPVVTRGFCTTSEPHCPLGIHGLPSNTRWPQSPRPPAPLVAQLSHLARQVAAANGCRRGEKLLPPANGGERLPSAYNGYPALAHGKKGLFAAAHVLLGAHVQPEPPPWPGAVMVPPSRSRQSLGKVAWELGRKLIFHKFTLKFLSHILSRSSTTAELSDSFRS